MRFSVMDPDELRSFKRNCRTGQGAAEDGLPMGYLSAKL
jgi:hypothetical protein